MITAPELTALIASLKAATDAFHQKLTETDYSDEEFDAQIEHLRSLHESGEYTEHFTPGSDGWFLLEGDVALGTAPDASAPLVNHLNPMLSLTKAKTREEVIAFHKRLAKAAIKGLRLQAKFDGIALSALYRDGKLVHLATRGSGTVGENVTHLATATDLTIKGLPATIEDKGEIEVRGELLLTQAQFDAASAARAVAFPNQEPYSLIRSALVGMVKKAALGLGFPVEFTFAAYSYYKDSDYHNLADLSAKEFISADTYSLELYNAHKPANGVAISKLNTAEELEKAIKDFGLAREKFPLPTDGVVVKAMDEATADTTMGASSHSPRSQLAFKYPPPTAITELIGIDLTVGKTGKVTPVGRLKPVMLDGSLLSNLSLHNFHILYRDDIRVGSTVQIHKANEIIPQVESVLHRPEGSTLMPVPTVCPVCETGLEAARESDSIYPAKTLRCPNHSCPSRDFFALKTAVAKDYLNIDGMSVKLLTHLNDIGRVSTIADLYTLTLEELQEASFGTTDAGEGIKLGVKRAQNILDHIELSKEIPMERIVAALAITGLGRRTTKKLMTYFPTIDDLLSATYDEIKVIPDMGDSTAEAVTTGLHRRAGLIQQLRGHGVKFAVPEVNTDTKLAGLSFAISGAVPAPFASRNEWVAHLEANGAQFHSSPKAVTTYFVGNEEDTSSKAKAAVKHRDSGKSAIQIISPEKWTELYMS